MAIIYPRENKLSVSIEKLPQQPLSVPVNIERLIRELNINIVKEDMEYGMSGYIEKRADGWKIGINKYDSLARKRFTLAHELGHYILHRDRIIDTRHEDYILLRDNEFTPIEREANEFAAELLMPEKHFREYIQKGITKFKDLADKFDVSVSAIKYRAYKLGYKSSV